MDVIRLRTWMLSSENAVDHGRHVGTDGICLDVIMVGRCSVGTDGICLDVIMVGTWMLCGSAASLSGRYHGWHMDALWERTEFVWTLRQERRFRHSKSSKYRKYQGFRGLHARAAAPPQNTREAERFQLQSPRSTANTDAVGLCAARVYSTSVPITTNPYETVNTR